MRLFRLERHELGPRLFVLNTRVHEWMFGAGLLGIIGPLIALDVLRLGKATAVLAGLGFWLVAKDWQDLIPSRRDRGRWSWGLHRIARPLRPRRRGDWLPAAMAVLAGLTALINLDSALAPNMRFRGRLITGLLPEDLTSLSHALAIPASAGLLLAAVFLAKRRYRAWQGALGLLVVLGGLNLLKGLSYEEALLSWAAAGVLIWGRPAFVVAPARQGLRVAGSVALGVLAGTFALATGATWISLPGSASLGLVLRESYDLLFWQPGPVVFHAHLAHFPLAIGLLSLAGLLVALYELFRPLAVPWEPPASEARRLARDLIREHGRDTLAYFKLRADKRYLFSTGGGAFLGYRTEGRVLLVSGDPVGEPAALRQLLEEALQFASRHGLRVASLGASQAMLPLYEEAGLRVLYLGDEAILDTRSFSLEGRHMRGVRQAAARVERAGYRATLLEASELDDVLLAELKEVSTLSLRGEPERGFTMAMDTLRSDHAPDGLIVVARDEGGRVGGFLHFVPTFGRPAASLAVMRRLPQTPNGLIDYLVVRAVELLRDRGVEELSLNFAVLARYLREPRHGLDRLVAAFVRQASRWFQLESLYRFNAKFHPRWEPRYLVYENRLGLVPTALASLRTEGQLPSRTRPADCKVRSRFLSPRAWFDQVRRVPFTLVTLTALMVVALLSHTGTAPISHHWVDRLGFAARDLSPGQSWRVLASALITTGSRAFWAALLVTALILGIAEAVAGTVRTASVFWGTQVVTLVVESAVLWLAMELVPSALPASTLTQRSTGISVALIGSLGLLCSRLRRPWKTLAATAIMLTFAAMMFVPYPFSSASGAIKLSDDVGHLLAFPIGFGLASLWLRGWSPRPGGMGPPRFGARNDVEYPGSLSRGPARYSGELGPAA